MPDLYDDYDPSDGPRTCRIRPAAATPEQTLSPIRPRPPGSLIDFEGPDRIFELALNKRSGDKPAT